MTKTVKPATPRTKSLPIATKEAKRTGSDGVLVLVTLDNGSCDASLYAEDTTQVLRLLIGAMGSCRAALRRLEAYRQADLIDQTMKMLGVSTDGSDPNKERMN